MKDPDQRIIDFEDELPSIAAPSNRSLLNEAVETYKIPLETLEKLTGIGRSDLEAYASGDSDLDHLEAGHRSSALGLIAFLGMGINTPAILPEDRLRVIMNGLTEQFGLTPETLALHSGVEPSDAERFLAGRRVAAEKRFKLSVGVLFLYFLIYRRNDL
ncbi:HTH domain-containing protein [Saccharibacillus brassicae]|uniref:HTH domain-containing protein n=1 Tax=Saccharibacillus brassicae TaxID=2583377 RepID=UPI001239C38C